MWNMSFIIVWKVAGELQRPKNMTSGSKTPQLVLKAALNSSPSLIRILLLLFTKKNVYLTRSSRSLMMSLTERMWSRLCNWFSGGYCVCELDMDCSWEPLDRGLIGTWGGVNVISSCAWLWPAEVLAEVASYSPRV